MGLEIERKFLVARAWPKPARGEDCRQGYLATGKRCTVRVRTMGRKAFLTIKSAGKGLTRQEFEYPVPVKDALALLALGERPPVRKVRYRVRHGGRVWEVDEFKGGNAGLVVAEIELASERQRFPRPPWLGKEVTHDARYLNSSLYRRPFRSWRRSKRA